MTIAGWVIFVVIAAFIMAGGVAISQGIFSDTGDKLRMAIPVVIAIGICAAILAGMLFYYNHTEVGKRAYHTEESNLTGGLNRTVRVYDVDGELIVEYSGRFDVDHDESRILFDDENGNRHVIYYSVATVVIDEMEE